MEKIFSNEKYLFETSDNGNEHNEIMIAYNKEKYSKIGNKYTWQSDYNKNLSDYLDICLKDNRGDTFMVVGTRILVDDYDYNDHNGLNEEMKARARQGNKIAHRINELNKQNYKIIGGGDLNIGRRNNKNEYWNKLIFEKKLPNKIKVVIPDGTSHQAYKGDEYAGCPDLMFYSDDMSVDYDPYKWEFVNDEKNIYVDREFTKEIPASYPDHAQIIASFSFK